jgi:hypothetical protein
LINCPYSAGLTQFLYEMALTSRSVERSVDKNENPPIDPTRSSLCRIHRNVEAPHLDGKPQKSELCVQCTTTSRAGHDDHLSRSVTRKTFSRPVRDVRVEIPKGMDVAPFSLGIPVPFAREADRLVFVVA